MNNPVGRAHRQRSGSIMLPSVNMMPRSLRLAGCLTPCRLCLRGSGHAEASLTHSGGRLVQWGVQSLGDEYIGLYEARETVPAPDWVTVPGDTWENRLAEGWSSQTLYRYPKDSLGRWTWARSRLQRSLTRSRWRRLPLPPGSTTCGRATVGCSRSGSCRLAGSGMVLLLLWLTSKKCLRCHDGAGQPIGPRYLAWRRRADRLG